MSANNLMDGLTTYASPEELAATAVAAQEQESILLSIISFATVSIVSATVQGTV
jgi:hypothetical protein